MTRVAETVPTYLVTGILMLFLLGLRTALLRGLVKAVPRERRDDMRGRRQSGAFARRLYLLDRRSLTGS